MLIVFLVLIIGPVIVRNYLHPTLSFLSSSNLMQPTGQDNNDTVTGQTGSALIGGGGGATATGGNQASFLGGGGGGIATPTFTS